MRNQFLATNTTAAPMSVRHRIRVMWASASCVAAALSLVLLLGGWGAYQDSERLKLGIVQAEVTRVRSHAERTAGQIESELVDMGSRPDLNAASHAIWLRERWNRAIQAPDRLYAAVVDSSGVVLAHSDPEREGEVLNSQWWETEIEGVGPGVYGTSCRALTGGSRSLDVGVPIELGNQRQGIYHRGLNWEWLQTRIAEGRRRSLQRWGIVVGGILSVVLISSVFLYRITRRATTLENALALAHARRVSELSQLIVGLAHEIRNPLNAVRLNLFTADRVRRGDACLDSDEIAVMLGESVREIERVDELINLLLGYARPEPAKLEQVNVCTELRAVMQFLKPSFKASAIEIEVKIPQQSVFVTTGRGHMRQILLNLLRNAREAVDERSGRIGIFLTEGNGIVELCIIDNGPGISPANREKVFELFFSTKEGGSGLGLALVRSLVEAAGGMIANEDVSGGGCCFRVRWPLAKCESSSKEVSVA